MNILSITLDANSSACAMKDGVVIAAISEERFNKVKNYVGYPKHAVEFCANALNNKIDKVLMPSIEMDPMLVMTHWTRRNVAERIEEQKRYWHPRFYGESTQTYTDVFPEYVDKEQYPGSEFWTKVDLSASAPKRAEQFRGMRRDLVANHLGVPSSIVEFVEHHLCHSNYAYFASPARGEKVLSFTADGFGDYYCATIRVFSEDGSSEILMQSSDAFLGRLYRYTTLNLGMKPLEDEYKVMGLAPYATEYHWRKPYEIFKELLEVDGINIRLKNKPDDFYYYYKDKLESCRFDAIAGGLQKFLEETIVEWVSNAIDETGIKTVVFSGGVSMNVKAMMEVSKISSLKKLYVPGSGADESLGIGAAYHETRKELGHGSTSPLTNMYLGTQYTQEDIDTFVKDKKLSDKYAVVEKASPATVASLISDGNVVAVFLGKMEFGARALGARSILADPRGIDTVKRINYKIKNRDFWMPFAPVVLRERVSDYFLNEKDLNSPFMTIGFETTDLGKRDLKAALHQADETGRPQMIERQNNPMYYDIVKSFEGITGVGALLNTSFNLHGLPIVRTPEDALFVLENSGLDALLLEGTLIRKVA